MLLLISHELHRSRVNKAIDEANAKNQKVIASNPLPRKFTLKLMTEMQVTPAEFTDALSNPDLLNQWELRLKSAKKKAGALNLTLQVEYIGISSAHEISYDFEMLPEKRGT